MKFFVAFAALVAVAVAKPHINQKPAILPALVEHPVVGPVFVEHELVQPGFGPALVEFPIDHPVVGPVFVEHELVQPGFGPELIDFPINAEAGSPVVVGPVPEGSTPLVQIIINVAKPAGPVGAGAAEAGVGPSIPSIAPEYVQDVPAVGPAFVDVDEPVSGVIIADLPDSVIVADTPAVLEPVLIGTPQLPPAAVNIPNDLN